MPMVVSKRILRRPISDPGVNPATGLRRATRKENHYRKGRSNM